MKQFFYIPFFYLIHSRLKSKFELISWQIIFFIPVLIITYFYLETRSNIFIHLFLLSQLIFYSIYEIGYIENDILTTKKEKYPTIRLNSINTRYIKKNYYKIVFSKYLIFTFSFLLLMWIDLWVEYILNIELFLIQIILTRFIFYIHNNVRNRLTIITFFLLSILKYTFPIILFIDISKIHFALILAIISFPILRTIEIFLLKRFNFKFIGKIIKDIDKFRILYYLIIFFSFNIIYLFKFINFEEFYLALTIILYFLIFRIISFILIKGNIYNRDKKVKNKFQNKFR